MRYIWYIPDAVPSGLPTDESEILNYVLWESRTWEKIPEVHVGVGEVIERLFVTIFSFVADGVTYSSTTCTT